MNTDCRPFVCFAAGHAKQVFASMAGPMSQPLHQKTASTTGASCYPVGACPLGGSLPPARPMRFEDFELCCRLRLLGSEGRVQELLLGRAQEFLLVPGRILHEKGKMHKFDNPNSQHRLYPNSRILAHVSRGFLSAT